MESIGNQPYPQEVEKDCCHNQGQPKNPSMKIIHTIGQALFCLYPKLIKINFASPPLWDKPCKSKKPVPLTQNMVYVNQNPKPKEQQGMDWGTTKENNNGQNSHYCYLFFKGEHLSPSFLKKNKK